MSAACVATGDVLSGQSVEPSIWTTDNVLAGAWSRVRPLGNGGTALPYTIGRPTCLSLTFCYVNGSTFQGNATVYTIKRGYWVSTAPLTDAWTWHETGGDGVGPLWCSTPSICLLKDNDSLWFDSDAVDSSPGTRFLIEAQYGLALTGFFCRAADSCLAWGSDSGSASAGPLMAGKVWQGSPSDTVLGATPLPTSPGDPDLLPRAYDIACATVCVAIGALATSDFYESEPQVWTRSTRRHLDRLGHCVDRGRNRCHQGLFEGVLEGQGRQSRATQVRRQGVRLIRLREGTQGEADRQERPPRGGREDRQPGSLPREAHHPTAAEGRRQDPSQGRRQVPERFSDVLARQVRQGQSSALTSDEAAAPSSRKRAQTDGQPARRLPVPGEAYVQGDQTE